MTWELVHIPVCFNMRL